MVKGRHVHSAHWSGVLGQTEGSTSLSHFRLVLFRFIKFCLVGGSGVFVDMGILYLMADPSRVGLNITLSKICAAEIAMINNFIWNELWTFNQKHTSLCPSTEERTEVRRQSSGALFRRFCFFNAICGIGIGLSVLLLHLFHTWLGWNLYLSNLLAITLVTFWNFGMNARFNWCGTQASA